MGSKILTSSKADLFRQFAADNGWKAEVVRDGSKSTVVAVREKDGARLSISWNGNACINESTIEVAGSIRKLRNAAACQAFISGTAAMKPAEVSKTAKADKTDGVEVEDERPVLPPPDWGEKYRDARADEIRKAVTGRTIAWINTAKREIETATVPRHAQLVRVEVSPRSMRRVLTFAAAGEGFRSIYIERIVSVS